MDSVEEIVLAAWTNTTPFHASSPEERFKFMLEFLNCNGVGPESDDVQAAIIRRSRVCAGLATSQGGR